jgi:hypothetical protein
MRKEVTQKAAVSTIKKIPTKEEPKWSSSVKSMTRIDTFTQVLEQGKNSNIHKV